VVDHSSMSAVWVLFASAESGLADVSANRYLAERQGLNDVTYGPIPTRSGSLTTVGSVWALAILAEESEKRELALQFVEFMLDPAIQGAWTERAHRLPTRPDAFATWEDTGPYVMFLQRFMDVAVAVPNGPAFADFSTRLQAAQIAVLTGELSPDEAVARLQSEP
jgi:ABC-type glycerol-3-phosphate transport system substrate-binding protein